MKASRMADMGLPWPGINDLLIRADQADSPKDLCSRAVTGLNRLISFDTAYVFLLDSEFAIRDHEVVNVPPREMKRYLDYYAAVDPCRRQTPPDATTWTTNWHEFSDTEFFTDYGSRVDLRYSISMYLHNRSGVPGAVLVATRSGSSGFDEKDMAVLRFLQPGLSNRFKVQEALQRPGAPSLRALTKRERDVAELIARGHSTREIGALLAISENTAYRHLTSIFAKLNVAGRTELSALLLAESDPGRRPAQALRDGLPVALTRREREIVPLLCRGIRAREIGRLLFISEKTVYRHCRNIYARLGVSRRTQLAAKLLGCGLKNTA